MYTLSVHRHKAKCGVTLEHHLGKNTKRKPFRKDHPDSQPYCKVDIQ